MTCDSTSTATYSYSAAGCNEADKSTDPVSANTISSCDYFTKQVIYDVYLRMNTCIVNGNAISVDTFCDPNATPFPSASPTTAQPTESPTTAQPTESPTTAQPTDASSPPSSSPTMEPTNATSDPTKAPVQTNEDEDGVGNFVFYAVILSIVLNLIS